MRKRTLSQVYNLMVNPTLYFTASSLQSHGRENKEGRGRCERWLLGETSKSVPDTMVERQGMKEH